MNKITVNFCRTASPIFFITTCLILTLAACATAERINIENHIGLYEVVEARCDIEKGTVDPCEDVHFVELVKGQFMGVKDTDLAYVFWSGDPKIDPELQYTSFLLEQGDTAKAHKNVIWLNQDGETQEYFGFSDGKLTTYNAKYMVGTKGKVRAIHYRLKQVERGAMPHIRLNYPGNK